jgi:dihydrofolate reductase
MRKLVYSISMTLDGYLDHTHGVPDEEVARYSMGMVRDFDVFVFGRKTYEIMVPYWPDIAKSDSEDKLDKEFAEAFVSKQKVVFSRSLQGADAENTRIVRTNLREEILKLKQEPGKNILLGGVDIPSQLIALGLVDEFRFIVTPVLVGKGKRLFEGLSPEKIHLKLVESTTFKSSGSVLLRYLKQ